MKKFLFFGVMLGAMSAHAQSQDTAQSTYCKNNDFKDCIRVLKAKNKDTDFAAVYDQVCLDNKGFKCVKITIRGEPKEELAYQKTQYPPKAQLFLTKVGGEDKIYVIEQREGYKPPVPKKVSATKTTTKKTTTTTTTEKKSGPSSEVDVVDPLGPDVPLESE